MVVLDEQSSNIDTIITDLTRDDVVLGRGAGPNEHAGNIAFREVVNEFKPLYLSTANRKIKCQIARNVLKVVKARRGRFLKRAPGHHSDDDEVYVIAEDDVVLEKAKQALRHGTKGIITSRFQHAGSARSPWDAGTGGAGPSAVDPFNQAKASYSKKLLPTPSLSEKFPNTKGTRPGTGNNSFPAAGAAVPVVPALRSDVPEASPTIYGGTKNPDLLKSSRDHAGSIEEVLKVLIASEEQRRQDTLRARAILDLLHSPLTGAGSDSTTSTLQASPLLSADYRSLLSYLVASEMMMGGSSRSGTAAPPNYGTTPTPARTNCSGMQPSLWMADLLAQNVAAPHRQEPPPLVGPSSAAAVLCALLRTSPKPLS